ncbi:hypothetical protein D1007_04594 [Hordeum vulgare]|nr:hypothetical protein D1007_04594 [Hordeum vulgare]
MGTRPSRLRSHSVNAAREFIVRMEGWPRTWLRLPDYFMEDMEEHTPLALWLLPDSCCNGPSSVATEFNSLGFMSLGRWWKSFALVQEKSSNTSAGQDLDEMKMARA